MLRTLLRSDVAEGIGRLYKSGVVPTAQQRQVFAADRAARPKLASKLPGARPAAATDPENYAVVGSVAQICIEGVLSEEPDFWAWLFGMDGTTYEDIRDAFALAAADPLVASVILCVASPGGYIDGLFETLAAIEAFTKPITVQASQACSAAYSLAAMAGRITAMGPASCFGSVGVACSYAFPADVEYVDVTSTEAPNKRPDPREPEGKAVIVKELDDIHDIFVDAIARGRSNATGRAYTVDQVNADFGRGGVFLAAEARAAGMIDKMPRAAKSGSSASDDEPEPVDAPPPPVAAKAPSAPPEEAATPASKPRSSGPTKERKTMDLEKLKAEYPALYEAIVAIGRAEGKTAEHKRCKALLTLGEASGAVAIAHKAIVDGSSSTDEEVQASFLSASMKRSAQAAHKADSEGASKVVEGAAPVKTEALDNSDLVANAMGLKPAAPASK